MLLSASGKRMVDRNQNEKDTVALMIEIFCHAKHGTKNDVCSDCSDLLAYAHQQLTDCPFENKPKCSDCKVHCYDRNMRLAIKDVMRYAGPRMIVKHPVAAMAHYIRKKKN